MTFLQRQPNVFAVGPTLYKCYTNVVCLLGIKSCFLEPDHMILLQTSEVLAQMMIS